MELSKQELLGYFIFKSLLNMKKQIFTFFILLNFIPGYSQKTSFELYGGVNYGTINHILDNEQIVLAFKKNSPGYKIYPQVGVQLRRKWKEKINLTTGLKYQRKGDKFGTHQLIPVDTIYNTFLDFLIVPLNIEIKLLPEKNIFWIGGISGGVLFHQSKNIGLSSAAVGGIFNKHRFELAIQTGIRTKIYNQFDLQVLLSKGVNSLQRTDSNSSNIDRSFKTMSIESSIIYKFN